MRDIKFRAWDTENNKYFKPTYKMTEGKLEYLLLGMTEGLNMVTPQGIAHESTFEGRFIIEQYTGLTDSQGKEIYENDIVQTKIDGEVLCASLICFGEFKDNFMSFDDGSFLDGVGFYMKRGESVDSFSAPLNNATYTVVGNIHENQELLKGEQ